MTTERDITYSLMAVAHELRTLALIETYKNENLALTVEESGTPLRDLERTILGRQGLINE